MTQKQMMKAENHLSYGKYSSSYRRKILLTVLICICFSLAMIPLYKGLPSVLANPSVNASTYIVKSGDDLQAALDQANPGDTILLEAGSTFEGNFILPRMESSKTDWITIRTSATDEELPSDTKRITPSFANVMPKIVSPNSEAALRTKAGTHHIRLIGIELTIQPDVNLSYGILKLGDGNEANLEDIPNNLAIDRCYIHGQTLSDVARGIALNSANTAILNSYISECHGIGFDTQAIACWNGPGPFQIINNYLEGAGENVLFGGADPKVPELVPSDIEFRGNHCTKPLEWKEGILSKPTNARGVGVAGDGLLTGGKTYYYRVASRVRAGQGSIATSLASEEISVTLQANENKIQLDWDLSDLATAYRIYRTTDEPTAERRVWVYFDMDASNCGTLNAPCPFVDTGASDSAVEGELPTTATHWSVKNLFELKNARRVRIEGNLFEHNWADAQVGIAILFTPRNQEGSAPWSVVEDVTFQNNLVRQVAGAINILGVDNLHPSQQTKRIVIRNNLFTEVNGKAWGNGNGVFLTITEAVNVAFDHNTVLQSGNIISAYGEISRKLVFTNNILQHNEYGVIGDGTGTGLQTLNRYFQIKQFKKNAFIGGQESVYPALNYFFPSLEQIGFTDPAAGSYELTAASPLKGRGTDGKDVGCDVSEIRKAMNF